MADKDIRHVLIVEDMVSLQEHLLETLSEESDGIVADGAIDGVDALERIDAASQPYDLVITDLTMPRMDGEGLIRTLRERHFASPVIVLTAHGQDDLVIRCLKAGACDYLIKPVETEDLMAAVSTALQHMPGLESDMVVDYDPQGWFEVSGGSDYSVLYKYRRFLSLLDAFQLPEPELSEIRLALEELGRNAIEWGNREDPDKRVRFSCRILPYKVILQIADEGEGFNPDQLPDPTADPFAHMDSRKQQGKRLGGYGVHLIRNIMDKVTWNAKGNVVVAIKYLQGKSRVHL